MDWLVLFICVVIFGFDSVDGGCTIKKIYTARRPLQLQSDLMIKTTNGPIPDEIFDYYYTFFIVTT